MIQPVPLLRSRSSIGVEPRCTAARILGCADVIHVPVTTAVGPSMLTCRFWIWTSRLRRFRRWLSKFRVSYARSTDGKTATTPSTSDVA